MILHWTQALPGLLLLAGLVTLPGTGAALLLRCGWATALTIGPALSLGIIALAVLVTARAHQRWSLAAVGVAMAVAWAVSGLARGALSRSRVRKDRLLGVGETRDRRTAISEAVWLTVLTCGGGVLIGLSVIEGIGSPQRLSQTYDAAFHINAIAAIARSGDAGPVTVAHVMSPGQISPFYPPLFHDMAALTTIHLNVEPGTAANLEAVIIAAVVWPLSMAFLVRTFYGRGRFALASAMVCAVAIPLFPALPLGFGVLWPNALSIAVLPTAVGLAAHAVGQTEHKLVGAPLAAAFALIALVGLFYSHPGAVFALIGIAVVLGVAVLVRWERALWRLKDRRRFLGTILLPVYALLLVAFWRSLDRFPDLKAVREFDWPAGESLPQAIGEALSLAGNIAPPVYILGALMVFGAATLLRRGPLRWVPMSQALMVWAFALAAGDDSRLSQEVTGFWYNDRQRLSAMIPVLGIPLIVSAMLSLRGWLQTRVTGLLSQRRSGRGWGASGTFHRPVTVASILTLIVVVALLPDRLGRGQVSETVRMAYGTNQGHLINDTKEAVYRGLAGQPRRGSVVGNPWTGEVFAGVLSGRVAVFPHFGGALDGDRALLSGGFKNYQSDDQVCSAVKRLDIAYAVESTPPDVWDEQRAKDYPGLVALDGVRGLRLLERRGTTSSYEVMPC